ncbi:MAG: hypothetical protein A2Y55_08235 [Actinobacteria bacterium RBG_16_68_12]|nr:MAG: hypothetical protein A2Y55_08235 [Actinobacteria bacterium RBG_16_68_12]
MRSFALVLSALAAVLVVVGPVGASGTKTLVTVRLKEFKVLPSPLTAKRGAVAFAVKNVGKVDHELVVLKTNVAPSKLPVKKGKAAEPGRVGRVGPIKPGASRTLTLTLRAGKYVLLCNLPGHYLAGQRIGFRVT